MCKFTCLEKYNKTINCFSIKLNDSGYDTL